MPLKIAKAKKSDAHAEPVVKKENAPKWLEASDIAAIEKCISGMRECLLHNEPVNAKQYISGMRLQTVCERGKRSVQMNNSQHGHRTVRTPYVW